MNDPWRNADTIDNYANGLDYRIEDKLDRLRAAVLALANVCLSYDEVRVTLLSLQTAEERREYHD